MDSTMTIQVRVVGRQAIASLQQVQNAVNGVAAAGSGGSAARATNFLSTLNGSLIKAGKNLQWVGRQLTFNFTLPLVAAGVALFRANQNITRSMIQVVKVYGDASFSAQRVKSETDALARSFELLSTRFGVHQEEVIDIAAAWASAGSAGVGLANNTRATMEAMILGELDATEATEGLIAIQATWQLSTMAVAGETSELTQALALLNVVENQTGIRFSGLIDVMARAGGAARTAGMSIRELAAFAAALVPATGSAAQAGNALKTMISRLQSPTKETADILGYMGINVNSLEWGSKTATEKILELADSFNALDTAAQNQVSSIIASRWQVNRFSVLMRDVASETGYFNKAMQATADQAAANAKYQQELMTVLESSPRKWDIMTNAIRNSMAKAFIPLMPAIMSIVGAIAELANAFQSLAPETQRMILIGLAMLAVVGPIMQLTGTFMELFGVIGSVIKGIAMLVAYTLIPILEGLVSAVVWAVGGIVAYLTAATTPLWVAVGTVVAVIAAIIAGLVLLFNEDLRGTVIEAIKDVGRAFAALPGIMVNVFNAVIRVISRAIEIIREALSYLNPFARHSPSLVDNVRAGVSVILDEYSKFSQIPSLIRSATNALNDFGKASAPTARSQQEAELQGYASSITANDPAAGAAASAMIPQVMALQDQLAPLAAEIAQQAVVVARWTAALNTANATLDAAQARLTALSTEFDRVSDAIDTANNRINDLANMPLDGMQAIEDTIFDISMQQAALNLELVNFERQGYTIDSIRQKYADLNGEIEMLRGEQASLRAGGAGSDVLSVYDDQIAALEAQRTSMSDIEEEIFGIQDALDALDLEKQFQELTASVTFDPLLREIDQLVNGVEEMSFDDVIAGILEQQALLAQLQPQYDDLAAAVALEEANVKAATGARDAIQVALDEEQRKLDGLNEAYSGIKSLIEEMTAAMRDFASASEAAAAAAGDAGGAGAGGLAEGDYGIQGGGATLGAEGGLLDIEAFNKELEAELQGVLEGMGNIDIIGGIKDSWNNAIQWIKDTWESFTIWFQGYWTRFSDAINLEGVVQWFIDAWTSVSDWFTETFIPAMETAWEFVSDIFISAWEWIDEHVIPVVEKIVNFLSVVWDRIGPFVKAAFALISGLIAGALTVIGGIIKVALDVLITSWGVAWGVISGIVSIVWDAIKGAVESALLIIGGIFDVFAGLFSGDWDRMWQGIKDIFSGVWQSITTILQTFLDLGILMVETAWAVLTGIFEVMLGAISTLWSSSWDAIRAVAEGIWNFIVLNAQGLKDAVLAVFRTLSDGVAGVWNGISDFLTGLWNGISTTASTVWEGIKNAVMNPIDTLKGLLDTAWGLIGSAAETAWNGIKSFIGGVITGIGSTVGGIWQGIFDGVRGAVNSVVRAINWVIDRINSFQIHISIDPLGMFGPEVNFDWDGLNIGKIPEWGGSNGGYTPNNGGGGGTHLMARGGIVDHATRAIIGEAGREVVIPLTDPIRALQLAKQSGLLNMLASRAGVPGSTTATSPVSTTANSSTRIIEINGNLEFPNITNAVDAERFIANLESLAS